MTASTHEHFGQVVSINASANQWDKNRQTYGKVPAFVLIFGNIMTDLLMYKHNFDPDANCDTDISGVRPRSKAFGEKETSCQPCHQVIGEEQALIL